MVAPRIMLLLLATTTLAAAQEPTFVLPAPYLREGLVEAATFATAMRKPGAFDGVVAGEFCVRDGRCRAALNLDGIPQSGTMIISRMAHPFLMVYSISAT